MPLIHSDNTLRQKWFKKFKEDHVAWYYIQSVNQCKLEEFPIPVNIFLLGPFKSICLIRDRGQMALFW